MPIEIRELVIKAVVTESPSDAPKIQRNLAGIKQEILEQCREELRELARRGNER